MTVSSYERRGRFETHRHGGRTAMQRQRQGPGWRAHSQGATEHQEPPEAGGRQGTGSPSQSQKEPSDPWKNAFLFFNQEWSTLLQQAQKWMQAPPSSWGRGSSPLALLGTAPGLHFSPHGAVAAPGTLVALHIPNTACFLQKWVPTVSGKLKTQGQDQPQCPSSSPTDAVIQRGCPGGAGQVRLGGLRPSGLVVGFLQMDFPEIALAYRWVRSGRRSWQGVDVAGLSTLAPTLIWALWPPCWVALGSLAHHLGHSFPLVSNMGLGFLPLWHSVAQCQPCSLTGKVPVGINTVQSTSRIKRPESAEKAWATCLARMT